MFDNDLFTKATQDVARINKIDPATPAHRLCKTYEEAGELTRAINKTLNRKYTTATKEEILSEILEELADTLQCVYSWWFQCNPEDIKNTEAFLNKIKIPLKPYQTVEQCVFSLYSTISTHTYVNIRAEESAAVVEQILNIAQCFNYTFDDINEKVLEKNKKWEIVTEKKNKKNSLESDTSASNSSVIERTFTDVFVEIDGQPIPIRELPKIEYEDFLEEMHRLRLAYIAVVSR